MQTNLWCCLAQVDPFRWFSCTIWNVALGIIEKNQNKLPTIFNDDEIMKIDEINGRKMNSFFYKILFFSEESESCNSDLFKDYNEINLAFVDVKVNVKYWKRINFFLKNYDVNFESLKRIKKNKATLIKKNNKVEITNKQLLYDICWKSIANFEIP